MSGEDVGISEVVRAGIDAALERMYKAGPGKVTAYDPVTNTAFVKPTTTRAMYSASGKRSYEELPEIPFVPVMLPRAGGMVLRLPLEAGDSVLLVYCDTSNAEWRESGEQSNPVDARLHGVGYPIAIPGLFPDSDPPSPADAPDLAAGGMILGADGGSEQMLIGGTIPGIRFGKLAVSPIALAIPTNAGVAGAYTAIAALVATVNALVAAYNAHTHLYAPGPGAPVATAGPVGSGSPAAAPAAAPATPATVASALVKSL